MTRHTFFCIDAHTCGNPVRVVVGGAPILPEAATRVGSHPAILPSVAGWARVTGHNTIYVDDRDPLAHGFQLA